MNLRRERTIYDVELTYKPDLKVLNPSEYQNRYSTATAEEKAEILNRYRRIAKRHINALHQSVRGHAMTRAGQGWSGYLRSVISCQKGYCCQESLDALKDYPEISIKMEHCLSQMSKQPDRLHIHLLVAAEPGRTVVEWICQYWQRNKKYGWVKKRKLEEEDLLSWYNEYTASQSLGTVTARFGSK